MNILAMRFITLFILLMFVLIRPAVALAASLSLSPSSGTFNKGCAFSLEIKLDTGGLESDGTDAILSYDQNKVTATSISPGIIYADYPGNSVDNDTGKVIISGLASVSSGYKSSGTPGTLATVNFTVKDAVATGATIIKFDFDANAPTKTTDSNVVQRGTVLDILSSAPSGNYIIGTGACTQGVPAPVTVLPRTGGQGAVIISTPSAEIPYKTLPPAGSEQLTFTIAIVGSVLTILGILGLALL